MGSFFSQLATAAEIWSDEVETYAHYIGKMYGKIGQKAENFHINGQASKNLMGQLFQGGGGGYRAQRGEILELCF